MKFFSRPIPLFLAMIALHFNPRLWANCLGDGKQLSDFFAKTINAMKLARESDASNSTRFLAQKHREQLIEIFLGEKIPDSTVLRRVHKDPALEYDTLLQTLTHKINVLFGMNEETRKILSAFQEFHPTYRDLPHAQLQIIKSLPSLHASATASALLTDLKTTKIIFETFHKYKLPKLMAELEKNNPDFNSTQNQALTTLEQLGTELPQLLSTLRTYRILNKFAEPINDVATLPVRTDKGELYKKIFDQLLSVNNAVKELKFERPWESLFLTYYFHQYFNYYTSKFLMQKNTYLEYMVFLAQFSLIAHSFGPESIQRVDEVAEKMINYKILETYGAGQTADTYREMSMALINLDRQENYLQNLATVELTTKIQTVAFFEQLKLVVTLLGKISSNRKSEALHIMLNKYFNQPVKVISTQQDALLFLLQEQSIDIPLLMDFLYQNNLLRLLDDSKFVEAIGGQKNLDKYILDR